MDGPNACVHDRIRNKLGLFDCVLECITKLQARQSQLLIGLNCVIQKDNLDSLSQMIDLAERIGVNILLFKIAHGEDRRSRFLPSQEEWKRIVEWISSSKLERESRLVTNLSELSNLLGVVFRDEDVVRGKPVSSFYLQEQIRCFTPLFFLTCDSEGYMYPCDYLQADTRTWGGVYGEMRNQFCLGNILEDAVKVLNNLAVMLRNRVHTLPTLGYSECGSCTRFCQLNAALTRIDRELPSDVNKEVLNEFLSQLSLQSSRSNFL